MIVKQCNGSLILRYLFYRIKTHVTFHCDLISIGVLSFENKYLMTGVYSNLYITNLLSSNTDNCANDVPNDWNCRVSTYQIICIRQLLETSAAISMNTSETFHATCICMHPAKPAIYTSIYPSICIIYSFPKSPKSEGHVLLPLPFCFSFAIYIYI